VAYALLNGRDVISATLTVPRSGAWRLDALVDAESSAGLTGAVTLSFAGGTSIWKGWVFRGGESFGRVELQVVGGAGGLARQLPGKSYRNTTARVVATDILSAAGETLSLAISPALLALPLAAWTRTKGSASTQLLALLGAFGDGVTWRVLADGSVWLGAESWVPAPALEHDLLEKDERAGRWALAALEGHRLLPGQTFEGRHISAVEHTLSAEAIRTHLFFEP
jgi:hypothetical protein